MKAKLIRLLYFATWIWGLSLPVLGQEENSYQVQALDHYRQVSHSLKQKFLLGYQQSEIHDSTLNPTTISQIAFRWALENRTGWEFGAEWAQSAPSHQSVGNLESQWKTQRLGLVVLAPIWTIHPSFSLKLEAGNFWAQTQVRQSFAGETLSLESGLLPYFKVGPSLIGNWGAFSAMLQWHAEYSTVLSNQPNTSFSAYLGLGF